MAPRILGSRGTPSKFVLYALKDMYAKFGAFTRLVTIFVNFDANGLDYETQCIKFGRYSIFFGFNTECGLGRDRGVEMSEMA